MKSDLAVAGPLVRKVVVGATVGLTVLGVAMCGGTAYADPDQDPLANLHELSQQVQQLTEDIHSAQLTLEKKLQLLGEADRTHADDLAALDAANAQLAVHQGAVDKVAASVYMGGSGDSVNALLTAASPKSLIDKLAVERVMTVEASDKMAHFRRISLAAQTVEAASARSAADARSAVDAATNVRADLQNKQSELKTRIAAATDQAALTAMPSAVMAALGYAAPIPTVGMIGLVPNARSLVAYIMATYPGVQSIGGVRADPIPDHPTGHAIDIMIGSDMTLGDVINADVQSQAERFGVKYTMWRVADHFNHVHVTVS